MGGSSIRDPCDEPLQGTVGGMHGLRWDRLEGRRYAIPSIAGGCPVQATFGGLNLAPDGALSLHNEVT